MKSVPVWSPAVAALIVMVSQSPALAGRLAGVRSLNDKPHGYAITREIARAGRYSQRFEVRAGDCAAEGGWSDCRNDRERSEIRLVERWPYGANRWFGYSVYLPADFQTSQEVRTTVGQIHQRGGPSGKALGLPSFPPLMQMEMRGDSFYMGVHLLSGDAGSVKNSVSELPVAKISQMRGRWTDIQIHFDTSGKRQLLEVFANGEKKGEIRDWINFRPKDYYFKYGIYRSFVSRHGAAMPTQILYIDEVKTGSSRRAVSVDEKAPVD